MIGNSRRQQCHYETDACEDQHPHGAPNHTGNRNGERDTPTRKGKDENPGSGWHECAPLQRDGTSAPTPSIPRLQQKISSIHPYPHRAECSEHNAEPGSCDLFCIRQQEDPTKQ
jgi:hypothetical protein